jgi:hypothetical protein
MRDDAQLFGKDYFPCSLDISGIRLCQCLYLLRKNMCVPDAEGMDGLKTLLCGLD